MKHQKQGFTDEIFNNHPVKREKKAHSMFIFRKLLLKIDEDARYAQRRNYCSVPLQSHHFWYIFYNHIDGRDSKYASQNDFKCTS